MPCLNIGVLSTICWGLKASWSQEEPRKYPLHHVDNLPECTLPVIISSVSHVGTPTSYDIQTVGTKSVPQPGMFTQVFYSGGYYLWVAPISKCCLVSFWVYTRHPS